MKCYHFCTKEFYEKLLRRKEIIANDLYKERYKVNIRFYPEDYIKQYVFGDKNINNGNGMFFAWSNPAYKAPVIEDDNGEFILLELEVEEKDIIKTDYENWCNVGVVLLHAHGDLKEADKIVAELGLADLNEAYECIYNISEESEIQILLPSLKTSYIRSFKSVSSKNV